MLKFSLVQLIDSLLPQVGFRSSLRWVIWVGLQSGVGCCGLVRPSMQPAKTSGALSKELWMKATRPSRAEERAINSCPSPMEAATSNPALPSPLPDFA